MPSQLYRAAIDDALTTLQNAVVATGNGTQLDVKGWAVAVVQVTIATTATVTFEVTLDGTTWVSAQAVNVATGATATTATASADFLVAVAGFEYFRARVSAWTSGAVTVKGRATPFDSSVTNAAAGAETVTANQGSAGASAWPVKGAGTAGTADTGVVTVQGIASGTAQPVSSTTLATVAKQPALGTAGTASADVITVQGIASGTVLPVTTVPASTAAANILNGTISAGSTSAAATLITVPQGRTWVGVLCASVQCYNNAAATAFCRADAVFATAGTNVTPAAGTILTVRGWGGGNAATGTVGTQGNNFGSLPVVVIAPAGNSVTVTVQTIQAGTDHTVDAFACGQLL